MDFRFSAFLLLTTVTGLSSLGVPSSALALPKMPMQMAQLDRAERTCVDAVEDRGYQVDEILETNSFSGGAEIILEVRGQGERLIVGCDYSQDTRQVDLYRLEGGEYDRYSNRDDDRDDDYDDQDDDRYRYETSDEEWRNEFYNPDGVRDEGYAADIAREVVGLQLGIDDPYSEIVRIEEVDRNSDRGDRNWVVEGRANGAPFVVRIRASDGYILDFDVY